MYFQNVCTALALVLVLLSDREKRSNGAAIR